MDNKKYAMDIAEVRKLGITNMFDRIKVIEVLKKIGCNDTANYLKNNKNNYIKLLEESGNY